MERLNVFSRALKGESGIFFVLWIAQKAAPVESGTILCTLMLALSGFDGSGTSDFLNKFRVMRQVILTNEETYTAFIFFRRSFT
jgi:hypothetical protein